MPKKPTQPAKKTAAVKTATNDSPLPSPPPSPAEVSRRFFAVRDVVTAWWPEHWPIHEACLATAATLFLENIAQCVALVLVGDSGSGKGSILYGYTYADNVIFRSRFTAASILSAYGEANRNDLSSRALFRVVKHKLFVCSDLNPLLKAGDRDHLSRFYADMAVWLDGEGLIYDSGTHGALGERGDFTFALLGAATPFRLNVWKSMAELGPRLLFRRLAKASTYVAAADYDRARDACGTAVRDFVNWLFQSFDLRSQPWRATTPSVDAKILRFCKLAAAGQTFFSGRLSVDESVSPTHSHLVQRLSTLVHARAFLHGRSALDESDLAFAEGIARTSCPGVRGAVLFSLDCDGEIVIPSIAERTGLAPSLIANALDDLQRCGLVESCGLVPRETAGRPAAVWKLLV